MTTRRELKIDADGVTMHSLLIRPEGSGKVPAVLVFPKWTGRTAYEEDYGEKLAALGYAALICDLYGGGRSGGNPEECTALMTPLMEDRAGLRTRLLASLEALRGQQDVDGDRIAAAGFCFGGLCAIDLARAGGELKGVASFHGLLTPPDGLEEPPITATIAVHHGWSDPMAKPDSVVALGEELTARGADWYLTAYGNAVHSFTYPPANDPASGSAYDAHADRRSWRDFTGMLGELFA